MKEKLKEWLEWDQVCRHRLSVPVCLLLIDTMILTDKSIQITMINLIVTLFLTFMIYDIHCQGRGTGHNGDKSERRQQ